MQKAFVLNLKHRTDRWEQLQKDFVNVPVVLERVDGIIYKDNTHRNNSYYGVAMTHIELIKEAKERGDKTILIIEDDCLLEEDGWNRWIVIKQYLDTHLDDWEIFNGGIIGMGDILDIVKIIDVYLVKEVGGCCCHFLYVNVDKAYNKLMNWEINKREIDLYYSFEFNYWASYPLLAIQRNGSSDIMNEEKDWSFIIGMTKSECIRKIGNFLMG